jgi:hypothetical protein
MARKPISRGPTSDDLEGLKSGARYVTLGIFAACLIVLFLLIGFGTFGTDESGGPIRPQPTTQSPASSGSTNP